MVKPFVKWCIKTIVVKEMVAKLSFSGKYLQLLKVSQSTSFCNKQDSIGQNQNVTENDLAADNAFNPYFSLSKLLYSDCGAHLKW